VDRRDRPARHDVRQCLALRGIELWPIARSRAADQPGRAAGIEAQHPIAHRLKADPTDASRVCPRPAIVDRRQSHQPANLRSVLRRLRQNPQALPIKVIPKPDRRRHAESSLLATESQTSPRLGIWRLL
jgi:hypothetical protein